MKGLSFTTDRHLNLCSWGQDLAKFTARPPSKDVLGKKYYEVLPRIYVDEKDALSVAIKKSRQFSLKDYQIPCLYSTITCDIQIRPLRSKDGRIDKVKVTLHPHSGCSVIQKLDQSQRLIDIGKTASTLAHGVRNPLNAIKGAVVYLGYKYGREETLAEFTKIMEEEISRLEQFISKFLSSSIKDAELSVTNINALLKKIEVFTSLQASAGNIEVSYELGDVPPVVVDAFQIEQAVLNVINNAMEAMGRGGRLTVRSFTENRAGCDFTVIEVADTGPGMPVMDVDHAPPAVPGKGKGFGLFLTHEILKCYSGFLTIESKKLEGTTVRLFLPARQSL